MALISFVSELI